MLLRIGGGVRHPQLNLAGLYVSNFYSQRRHRGLARETHPDTGLEAFILRGESCHLLIGTRAYGGPSARLFSALPWTSSAMLHFRRNWASASVSIR